MQPFVRRVCLAFTCAPLSALAGPLLELATGTSVHLPSRLVVHQAGQPTWEQDADWSTEPFGGHAPYYRVRAGWGPFFIEVLHDKLHLDDTNAVVQDVEISHGYTLVGPGAMFEVGGLVALAAGGVIVTRAHSTVRGLPFEADYAVSGGGGHVAAAWWVPVTGPLLLTFEVGATAAWAEVDIARGSARVPSYSLHLTAGAALRP